MRKGGKNSCNYQGIKPHMLTWKDGNIACTRTQELRLKSNTASLGHVKRTSVEVWGMDACHWIPQGNLLTPLYCLWAFACTCQPLFSFLIKHRCTLKFKMWSHTKPNSKYHAILESRWNQRMNSMKFMAETQYLSYKWCALFLYIFITSIIKSLKFSCWGNIRDLIGQWW